MSTAAEPFGVVFGRSVYLPEADAVVVADLHLGRAAGSVDAPVDAGPEMVDRMFAIIDRFEPAELVIAGDVLDAFDAVPRAARTALRSLRSGVVDRPTSLVVLEGNHDVQLSALIGDEPLPTHELRDGTLVCHGHEVPVGGSHRYIIGHDHPAIVIEGRRLPCFLYGSGTLDNADVLALPAFNPALPGTTVNEWTEGDPLSPLLVEVSDLRPVVWDPDGETPLVFPRLGSLRPYL